MEVSNFCISSLKLTFNLVTSAGDWKRRFFSLSITQKIVIKNLDVLYFRRTVGLMM